MVIWSEWEWNHAPVASSRENMSTIPLEVGEGWGKGAGREKGVRTMAREHSQSITDSPNVLH